MLGGDKKKKKKKVFYSHNILFMDWYKDDTETRHQNQPEVCRERLECISGVTHTTLYQICNAHQSCM